MATRKPTRPIRVMFLGEPGTGKTSLISQYVLQRYPSNYRPTIGADFLAKDIELIEGRFNIQIWDLSGQTRSSELGPAFCRGADCGVLVYDVTNKESLHILAEWRTDLLAQSGIKPASLPFVLVGNKVDCEGRRVNWGEARTWARRYGDMPHFEVSVKDGYALRGLFEEVARSAACSQRSSCVVCSLGQCSVIDRLRDIDTVWPKTYLRAGLLT